MLTLAEKLQIKKSYQIRDIVGDEETISRLLENGFTKGEVVQWIGKAPFGEPVIVTIRGGIMALRKNEAACLQIVPIEDSSGGNK